MGCALTPSRIDQLPTLAAEGLHDSVLGKRPERVLKRLLGCPVFLLAALVGDLPGEVRFATLVMLQGPEKVWWPYNSYI